MREHRDIDSLPVGRYCLSLDAVAGRERLDGVQGLLPLSTQNFEIRFVVPVFPRSAVLSCEARRAKREARSAKEEAGMFMNVTKICM